MTRVLVCVCAYLLGRLAGQHRARHLLAVADWRAWEREVQA